MIYIVRENHDVSNVRDDHLTANAQYGASLSMLEELNNRVPHADPIFCDDNKTVFMMISKSVAGTSVESTITSYSRCKYGQAAFLALIAKRAGDTKYQGIVKSRINLLRKIKWDGHNYYMEQHVSDQWTAIGDLCDCTTHISIDVPNTSQGVELLLESTTSQDNAVQAATVNTRSDSNSLRSYSEGASVHLTEVDPNQRSTKYNSTK